MRGKEDQNTYINELILSGKDIKLEVPVLRSMRDLVLKGGDLTRGTIERKSNFDFDFKRKPVRVKTVAVNGFPLIYFDTVPWESRDEFLKVRAILTDFRRGNRVIRTEDDYADFEAYVKMQNVPGHRSQKQVALIEFKKQILRAFKQGNTIGSPASKLKLGRLENREIEDFMESLGLKVSKYEVKHAGRIERPFIPHSVPRTPELVKLCDKFREAFPAFDPSELWIEEAVPMPISVGCGEYSLLAAA